MLSRQPQVVLIYAVSNNGIIGKNNDIPWKSMHDFKWFRNQTIDNVVIMGRKTWESLPTQPLPRRENYVITSDEHYAVEARIECQLEIAHSLEDAITRALKEYPDKKIFIIGGKALWEEGARYACEAYISEIAIEVKEDATCVRAPELPKHEVRGVMDLFEGDEHEPAVKVKIIRFTD